MLRRNMTPAEVILWSQLKGKQLLGYKFRRQYSIGSYVLDFYCPELKLAIEIDGGGHFHPDAQKEDAERQKYVQQFGIKFLRFTSLEIYKNQEGVMESIANAIEEIKKV